MQDEWPARGTEAFESLMDFIATGARIPDLLHPSLDAGEVTEQIRKLRGLDSRALEALTTVDDARGWAALAVASYCFREKAHEPKA
mgnify:CR=1 FL=1